MLDVKNVIERLSVIGSNYANMLRDDDDGISGAQHDLEAGPVDNHVVASAENMPVKRAQYDIGEGDGNDGTPSNPLREAEMAVNPPVHFGPVYS